MSKHTPGPWVVGPVDDCTVTAVDSRGNRTIVAEIDGDYNEPDLWPIMEANARLISAAPDLLEALKWAAGRLTYTRRIKGQNDEFCDGVDMMNAAIAKAEGKQ